jgi:hypothetical protein
MPYNISRRFEATVQGHLEAAGVRILKRHYARKPLLGDDGTISAILAEDLAAFETVQIDAQVVIEASGDGEIGALAGADYDVGSEARDEFGERSAPDERNAQVQGTSLVAIAQRTDREVVFVPPANTPPFQPRLWHSRLGSYIHHHDDWFRGDSDIKFLYVTETGGHMDTIRDDGAIYELLLDQLWAEWDHIKNGPHREEAACWDLLWVSPKAGKRESRRFLGDVMLTQTDLESGRRFPDDIAYGGHDLDDHRPFGEGGDIFAHSIPPMYGIPYRACYSRNVPNLLLAGRLISATHLAHSSTRLMRTGGAIGQAVGYAAALCCRHGCTPRAVFEHHLDALQQGLMEADATILCLPVGGDLDLARQATVTASSEWRFNDQSPGMPVPLTAPAGVVLWDWPERLEAVELYLENPTGEAQPLFLSVHRARREPRWKSVDAYHRWERNDLRDGAFIELEVAPFEVPSGHVGWLRVAFSEPVNLGRRDPACDDDRVLIALDENPQVRWALAAGQPAIAEMVEHHHYSTEWHSLGVMAALRLTPPPGLGEAANAINGFHRRFGRGPTNMWISHPEAALPQDLVLTWDSPQTFGEVHLTFDNLAPTRHELPWECGARVLPILVEAYELACWSEDGWQVLVQEERNHHRFCRHAFAPVTTTRLRLRVLSTHSAEAQARVYQVRVLAV